MSLAKLHFPHSLPGRALAPTLRQCVALELAQFITSLLRYLGRPQHCLYFSPEPQGQGSLRPTCSPEAMAA